VGRVPGLFVIFNGFLIFMISFLASAALKELITHIVISFSLSFVSLVVNVFFHLGDRLFILFCCDT